ncbi:MAG TPA: FtsQ-type POTRA domain-containing protein [Candidatus Limnocylindria bacterium]|nr:FtsQ-type POTRA domain-containing protein [Candidatus Limnocylindria bacterium]
MIEYKAYHKKSLGKRKRSHVAQKRKKGSKANRGRIPVRQWLPVAAALLVLLLVGSAGAAVYSWLGRSAIFSVRVVDMNPCEHVSGDEISGILKGVAGGNIWSLSKEEIGRRLQSHPFVREVVVRKSFPDKLVVNIEEREPVAMINLDALYYVDDQGTIFKRLTAYDAKDKPILTGFSRDDLAAKDPVTIRNLKKTIDLLRHAESGSLSRNISEVHFDAQDGYTLVTRDFGLQLKIGLMDFDEAMRRVEEAMPKLASLGKEKGVVDLKTAGRIFVRSGE